MYGPCRTSSRIGLFISNFVLKFLQVHFGKYTTGASDDLNKVTQIIYQLVQVYGMNDTIGQLAFPQKDGQWPQDRVYGETTAQVPRFFFFFTKGS